MVTAYSSFILSLLQPVLYRDMPIAGKIFSGHIDTGPIATRCGAEQEARKSTWKRHTCTLAARPIARQLLLQHERKLSANLSDLLARYCVGRPMSPLPELCKSHPSYIA